MNNPSVQSTSPADPKKAQASGKVPMGGDRFGRSGPVFFFLALINIAVLSLCTLIYLQQGELVEMARSANDAEVSMRVKAAMEPAQQLIDELLLSARNISGETPPNPAPEMGMKVLTGPNAGKIVGIQRSFMTFGTPGTHAVMAISKRGEGYVAFHLKEGPNGEKATLDGRPLTFTARLINPGDFAEVAGVRIQFLMLKR